VNGEWFSGANVADAITDASGDGNRISFGHLYRLCA
jgi:hypothetical protein